MHFLAALCNISLFTLLLQLHTTFPIACFIHKCYQLINIPLKRLINIYYSKFAKDQLFDLAYCSPIANDTPVCGPHDCVLKLSIYHEQLAITIFNSLKSIFICITNTQK